MKLIHALKFSLFFWLFYCAVLVELPQGFATPRIHHLDHGNWMKSNLKKKEKLQGNKMHRGHAQFNQFLIAADNGERYGAAALRVVWNAQRSLLYKSRWAALI